MAVISHIDADGVVHAVILRSRFNYDRDAASLSSGLECLDESKAQQNFKDECDINTIVRRFGLTGQLPENVRTPRYEDYSEVFDFQSAMNSVRAAGEGFMELPAHIRAKFANDPQQFLEFCADDKNYDQAVELGLVKRRPEAPATPTPQASPTGENSSST